MDYENIFNRAKAAYGTGAYDDATLEFIFPELAESEDERIRKEIIDIVEAYRANCVYEGTHKFDDCLAWLERQKEQKPVENSGKELLYVSNKSYNIGYRDGKMAAESEQEWSVEDETCLEYALWCVMKTRHFVAKDACDLDACRCAERWLRTLHPSWKPSEEQMDALKSKLPIIKGTGNNVDSILESLYEQLKKLI